MAYEIDFVGTDKAEKDYDAIAFRYYRPQEGRWIKCVYDGGTTEAGEALLKHLEDYYFVDNNEVDYVFCSHPDLDHASGLRIILENVRVHNLVMNRPWEFIDRLYDKIYDGRISKNGLERKLRDEYNYVDELEKLAKKQNCKIIRGMTIPIIAPEMIVLSPNLGFYIKCLTDSITSSPKSRQTHSGKMEKSSWHDDAIREGEETTADNESSIVLRVTPTGDAPFLLLGDVGCRGLSEAIKCADARHKPINECTFLQIPHHGGRHNVSPSLLNKIVGPKMPLFFPGFKTAFVSVGKNSTHPKKSVVNAFISRGCKVFVSRGNTISYSTCNAVKRSWLLAEEEPFSSFVEKWDN